MARTRRSWIAIPIVLGLVAAAAALRPPAGSPGSPGAPGAESYRYRFQRAERGSIRRALEAAIAFHQARLARDPESGLELAALGRTYLRMARATGDLNWYLLAEQAGRRSLASLPFQNRGAVLVLARIAEARHDFAEARRLARQALPDEDALSVMISTSLAQGRADDAARFADMLVEQAPTMGAFTLQALVAVTRGDDTEALAAFDRAIAAEEPGEAGGSAWARTLLGRFHAKRGRLDLARSLYGEALAILPQYPPALINLAELEARTGDYEAASRHFAEVVDVSAASPNVYDHVVLRGFGRVRLLRGDAAGAEEIWARAEARLRLDAAEGAFGHRRELARLLLDRGRPADLREVLSLLHAEVRVRRDADTLDSLAWAYSRAGRWVEARKAIQEALGSGVREAALFARAASIEEALGDRARARRFAALAVMTDPRFDESARRAAGLGL
jgi:tetratricopeptide (TPR) repeat protein